jgi:glycolate oxidase iron-sulfur subunit
VQYGKLIEPFRIHLAKTQPPRELGWLKTFLLFKVTPYASRMRWALKPAKLMQWTGIDWLLTKIGLFRILPRSMRQFHDMLPPLRKHYGNLPEVMPAEGKRRARVAMFVGCAGDAFFPQTNLNTSRVLQKNGCEVWMPRAQVCCGALHYHAAQEEPAHVFARKNLEVFLSQDVDAIIINAAGCGAQLKDYGHLLHTEEAAKFAAKVKDVSEFLMELGPVKPTHPLPLRGVYHDACHLCHGQQIRKPPRDLLGLIPGLQLVPLNESEICCGAAGSYNLTEPEMSERLGERKAKNLLATGADAVFTGNVGCLIQIIRYLRDQKPGMKFAHPIDALWASYSGEPL